jgi:hypothetical protein
MVVGMRVTVIAAVLKSIAPLIMTPEPAVSVYALSLPTLVVCRNRVMHREAVHPAAMTAPCAAAMGAAATTTTTTTARQRARVAQRHSGEADDGDDHQCSCRHRSPNSGRRNANKAKYKFRGIIAALARGCDSQIDQKIHNS